jgi:acyl carrier protein
MDIHFGDHILGETVDVELFFDLGVTSLDYYSIIMELAKEFRVSFPNDNEMSFKTAAEFADYIEKHR